MTVERRDRKVLKRAGLGGWKNKGRKAPAGKPPQPVSVELGRYLNRNNIRGADREKALGMMDALLGAGFHLIDAYPMWVCYHSERGERIFADVFFEIGKARLLWKDIGSEETTKAVLEFCSRTGVPAYYPFGYKETTNGQEREAKAQEET